MTWSIRARLTGWYSGVVVFVLIAVALSVALLQERRALQHLDEELARLMLTLQGVMRTEFREGLDLQGAADEASTEVVAPDRVLVLTHPDGELLAIWGRADAPTWRPPMSSGRTFATVAVGPSRARLLSEPVADQGRRYHASVLAPLNELDMQRAELRRTLMASVVVALCVAALGGWIVGRQALRPLADMATQARSIVEDNPVERLKAPYPADELGMLALAFNGLLDRLTAVLHAQRQFMADASHELRTPVSVVQSTAQVTLAVNDRSAEDYRESMAIVGEQADRLTRLVDAMFLRSRAEARGLPLVHEVVYLGDIVAECTRALRVLALERHVEIETRGHDEIMFIGDDLLSRQMVSNLVDNAVRHATRVVAVTTLRTPDAIEIVVSDDGPGIPSQDRERIFQRFVRLDSQYLGAGLGLPIAKWIAEAHGGGLTLQSSGPAGSAFVVRFPAAAAAATPECSILGYVPPH